MSQRTWVCIDCGKSYRRDQQVLHVSCALCNEPCEYVHWKIRIPSPAKPDAWTSFWKNYREEKATLERYHAGELKEQVDLEILNMRLIPKSR